MNLPGFTISDMTDQEFATWLSKKDSNWDFNHIGENCIQFICNKKIVAVIKYKNSFQCDRIIFIKN